jgi:hypothetical protein
MVMKHLDDGLLQAFLDGELPPGERAAAEAHLAACGPCARALGELEAAGSLFGAALARADVPAPVATAQMSVRRRRAQAAARGGFTEARKALLRAALLVLGVAGVAAAAVPGSPVRALIAEVLAPAPARVPDARPPAPAPAPAPVAEAPRAPAVQGVFLPPEEGRVHVVLSGTAGGVQVRARLTDAPEASVYAPEGARFRRAPGRIEVVGARGGEVRIELPRAAREAVVEVNGRVFVAKDGEALRVMHPGADPSEAEAVFRVDG